MDKLVLNPLLRVQIDAFVTNPGHILILVGQNGSGKSALATSIINKLLNTSGQQLTDNRFVLVMSPQKGNISIESVRDLQNFVKLKTTGSEKIRRAVFIEHAETLSIEAQNALLKLLEEPPEDTIIIMSVHSSSALLPTIYSRAPSITVKKPAKDDLIQHFVNEGNKSNDVQRVYNLTNGLPGLMHAMLNDEDGHPLVAAVATAKTIIESKRFERLLLVNNLSKDKTHLNEVIFAIQRIAQASLSQSLLKEQKRNAKRWNQILKECLRAGAELGLNANTKLLLTNLFLKI